MKLIVNTNVINLKIPKIKRNQNKIYQYYFFNRDLDFLKINKIDIKNMKKLNCEISAFGILIPSKSKLNIRSKFIYV